FSTVTGGTALSSDYTSTSGVITFNPGETSRSFSIPTTDDAVFEGSRTVLVQLSTPTSPAQLQNPSTATLTINDNEAMPTMNLNAPASSSVTEGGSTTMSVTLTNASRPVVSASIGSCGGTAVQGTDYTLSTSTVTFPSGSTTQTVTFQTIDNTTIDGTR